jgi:hypothetical protein
MGEAKDLMMSLLIMLSLAGIVGYFITSTLISYNTELPAQYNTTLKLLGNTTGIESEIKTQKEYMEGLNKTSSEFTLFDIGGFWFQQALAPFKVMYRSLNIFESISRTSMDSLSDTDFGHSLRIIGNMLIMVVVLGIVILALAILLKWEL